MNGPPGAVWPPDAPPPMTWHPAYRSPALVARLLPWLQGESDVGTTDLVRVPLPTKPRVSYLPEGSALAEPRLTRVMRIARTRAVGRAPYVGRPYVYQWWVGRDELGRDIAGPDRIVYTDGG